MVDATRVAKQLGITRVTTVTCEDLIHSRSKPSPS